jgi:hypothetical protein
VTTRVQHNASDARCTVQFRFPTARARRVKSKNYVEDWGRESQDFAQHVRGALGHAALGLRRAGTARSVLCSVVVVTACRSSWCSAGPSFSRLGHSRVRAVVKCQIWCSHTPWCVKFGTCATRGRGEGGFLGKSILRHPPVAHFKHRT